MFCIWSRNAMDIIIFWVSETSIQSCCMTLMSPCWCDSFQRRRRSLWSLPIPKNVIKLPFSWRGALHLLGAFFTRLDSLRRFYIMHCGAMLNYSFICSQMIYLWRFEWIILIIIYFFTSLCNKTLTSNLLLSYSLSLSHQFSSIRFQISILERSDVWSSFEAAFCFCRRVYSWT